LGNEDLGKVIFKVAAFFLFLLLGFFLLAFLMKVLGLILSLAMGVLFIAAIFYLLNYLFKISPGRQVESGVSYKLSDYSKSSSALFLSEPTVKELIESQEKGKLTDWVLGGKVLEIENDTSVLVLADQSEKEFVRVKVAAGKYKNRQGWVCRSVLHAEPKLLDGR